MPRSERDFVAARLKPNADTGQGDARSDFAGFATIAEAVREATEVLRTAGLDEPLLEARWLVASVAGLSSLDLLTKATASLGAARVERIEECVRRRAAREPLSRILGIREFYGRDFELSGGTLDPRPDTEVLVEFVLRTLAQETTSGRRVNILDIGTGTGAILITLLAEYPRAEGLGIDVSGDAVATALKNAQVHDVAGRAQFQTRDIREGLGAEECFDFIVSNPPYIARGDIAGLEPEVRCHDPVAALEGGVDGLDFYRIFVGLVGRIRPQGWLVVEVGAGQAEDVIGVLLAAAPNAKLQTANDLSGHTRVVAIQPQSTFMGE